MTDRREEPRYQVGDVVGVTETIASAHTGRVGRVIHRIVSRYARTLDKYTLAFADDDTVTFWDIQLRHVYSGSKDQSGDHARRLQVR